MWACLMVLIASPSISDTAVWKIHKGGNTLFLGGTIHVLANSDYPLPPQFDQAYAQSEVVVLEADINALNDSQSLPQLMSQLIYTDGRTLSTVLSSETYAALERYANSKGLAIDLLDRMKPGMVAMTLIAMELQSHGLHGVGVDKFFLNRADSDGKPLIFLELVEDQLKFLAEMGEGQEDELVNYNLKELQHLPETLADMKSAWRSGDLDKLESLFLDRLKTEFPDTYQDLVVTRNQNWEPRILNMLKSPPVEFVLVGTLHLVGDDGLIEFLISQGYSVEKMK